jgi:hypothetical protein
MPSIPVVFLLVIPTLLFHNESVCPGVGQSKGVFTVQVPLDRPTKDGVDIYLRVDGLGDFLGGKATAKTLKSLLRTTVKNAGKKECVIFINVDDADVSAMQLLSAIRTIQDLRDPSIDTYVYICGRVAEEKGKSESLYVKDFVRSVGEKWTLVAPSPLPLDGQEITMDFRPDGNEDLKVRADFRKHLGLKENPRQIKGVLKWVVEGPGTGYELKAGAPLVSEKITLDYAEVKPFFSGNMIHQVGQVWLTATTFLDGSKQQIRRLDLGAHRDKRRETVTKWVRWGEQSRKVYLMRLVFVMKEPREATFLIAGPIGFDPDPSNKTIIFQEKETPTVAMFVVELDQGAGAKASGKQQAERRP